MARKRRTRRGSNGQFNVNIVPIVDCLTILVIFLLASGVYVTIGMLDVSLADGGEAQAMESKQPDVSLKLQLLGNNTMRIEVQRGESISEDRIAKSGNKWNYRGLASKLKYYRGQFPKVKTITVEAQKNVPYEHVVEVMDVTRKSHPDVLLGGF